MVHKSFLSAGKMHEGYGALCFFWNVLMVYFQ